MQRRYPWLWDVDLDASAFDPMLSGSGEVSLKERQGAMVRLIEYAPWAEIRRLLPRAFLLEHWPALASRVRSRTRREGMAFAYKWYQQQQPD
jgi:hypothetical protein